MPGADFARAEANVLSREGLCRRCSSEDGRCTSDVIETD
jgi:hypothetical protein